MKRHHPYCKYRFPSVQKNDWCTICDLLKAYDAWKHGKEKNETPTRKKS